MGVITDLVDKTEELLGHSPHPAIVTLPLGAWVVSNICDVAGLVTGNRSFDETARQSMGIGLIAAAGAAVTGLRDYSYIPKERPSHAIATKHAIGNAVVGTLFSTSYLLRKLDHQAGRRPSLVSRLLGLAAGSLGMYTAWLGGVLVEEQGEGVKPVMERLQKEEAQHKGAPGKPASAPRPAGARAR
jgi:uncharacterized membrane protein